MSHEHQILVASVAWALIHFLWQGLLIAGLLYFALQLMPKASPNIRYALRCAALGAMVLAPIGTFLWLRNQELPVAGLNGTALPMLSAASEQSLAAGLPWLVGIWGLGVSLLSLRLVGGCLQVMRLRRGLPRVSLSAHWQARFDHIARDFGVRAQARVVECAEIAAPVMIGWLRPVVLLPARIFTGLTDDQIEALLAHELAHVARRDYLVNIVQSIVEALLFYHPAIWWVSQGIREEREYCCDDRAVAATQDGLSYARALTALET
jgi:bla regulator protein BlaR1